VARQCQQPPAVFAIILPWNQGRSEIWRPDRRRLPVQFCRSRIVLGIIFCGHVGCCNLGCPTGHRVTGNRGVHAKLLRTEPGSSRTLQTGLDNVDGRLASRRLNSAATQAAAGLSFRPSCSPVAIRPHSLGAEMRAKWLSGRTYSAAEQQSALRHSYCLALSRKICR